MSQGRTVVLVHGIGGPRPVAEWITPLNAGLGAMGYPTLNADVDTFVNVDYRHQLMAGDSETEPPRTWKAADQRVREQQWASYLARKEAMAEAIEGARKRSAQLPLSFVSGTFFTDWGADWLSPVRRYRASRNTRNAVWSAVLSQLPTSGRVVVLAHSLGSIVMLDLLKRLPDSVHVDLLLTVGSPMGVGVLRRNHGGLDEPLGFPADRVGVWVNVYDRDDIVTVGRGASGRFPAALDAPINTSWDHDLRAYMSQPVAAAAVGMSAFGPVQPPSPESVARRLDPQWQPLLLRFAFTRALWSEWPKDEWNKRLRMDLARTILAQRAVDETVARREAMQEQASAMPDPIRDFLVAQMQESPMAPGHMPTFDDLYKHAGELMRNEYSDEQLVLAGIDLLLAEPFAPFGIEVSNSRITTALASLLQRIRKDASTTSGQEFASALSAAVKEARSALEEDSFPWSQVLVGTGLLILAATGVGLAVAAPAGLAGAAAITATMATFGPGGMAGGIATLAVLSGTSMAFTTTGLTLEGKSAPQFAKLQQTMAQEVAQLPSAAFRTALAGLLAVTSARRRLNLPSIATEVEATLLSIQATVLHEYSLHRQVASGSDPTKDWANKRDILDTALSWLAKKAKDDGIPSEIRQAVVAAIEGSTASPALPRSGPPRAITAGDDTPDPGDDS